MLVYKNQFDVITKLGKMFLSQNDYSKAIECFNLASKNGSFESLLELAKMYMNGNGLKRDMKRAKKYLKIISNNYKSDTAQYQLGMIYNSEKKYLKSKKYFELSANQDNTDALMKLGIIYRDGLGVKKDAYKTYQYFEKASKLGNAYAFFYLSVFCRDGFGTQKNLNRSRRYLKLSVRYDVQESFTNLGCLYIEEGNQELAKYYWSLSNNPKAQYNLGVILEEENNYKEAMKMYMKAANQYHSGAMFAIGKLYINGYGVDEDIDKALEYIVKAARLNDPNAIRFINETVDEFERDQTTSRDNKQTNSIQNYAI